MPLSVFTPAAAVTERRSMRPEVLLAFVLSLSGTTKLQAEPVVFWTDGPGDAVRMGDLADESVTDLFTLNSPYGIAVDMVNEHIYVTATGVTGPGTVRRANLDGTGLTTLTTTPTNTRQIDLFGGRMYWASEGTSGPTDDANYQANLDGTGKGTLVTDLYNPRGLEIDPINEVVYFDTFDLNPYGRAIMRVGLDGSNLEELVTNENDLWGLGLDIENGKMYWSDGGAHRVRRANLDGTDVETFLADIIPGDIAVDPVDGYVYIGGPNGLTRTDLDGGNLELFFAGQRMTNIWLQKSAVPEPSSVILCGVTALGLVALRRRRKTGLEPPLS